ncbi:hypothetical protein ACWGJQ_14810 [Peribacillus simplex]
MNIPNNKIEMIKQSLLVNNPPDEQVQKLEKLKQILPSNHPIIQMMEGNFKQVEQTQRPEKLRNILPPN